MSCLLHWCVSEWASERVGDRRGACMTMINDVFVVTQHRWPTSSGIRSTTTSLPRAPRTPRSLHTHTHTHSLSLSLSLSLSQYNSRHGVFASQSLTVYSCHSALRETLAFIGLPHVPLLPGRPVFWPLSPAYRRNPDPVTSCPVFSVTRVPGTRSIALCVVFCTFAGVNFLAESGPESMNLHRKFQNFFGSDTPTTGDGDPFPHMHTQHGRNFNCLVWQPYILVEECTTSIYTAHWQSKRFSLRIYGEVLFRLSALHWGFLTIVQVGNECMYIVSLIISAYVWYCFLLRIVL